MKNSILVLNQTAVKEAKTVFYRSCDTNRLTDKDLLILILEPLIGNQSLSTVADDILQKGLPYLATLSEFELSTLFGLTETQSFHLMSVFEMSRRIHGASPDEEIIIRSSNDVTKMLWDITNLDREHFIVIYLNVKNRVIGRETISIGSLNAAIVHPREVFKAAIRRGAASIICAHNHPSGKPDPSSEDIELTKRLVEAGEIVGIEVLDHIIVGQTTYSFKENGNI
ncbi:RadC family protein [Paenibacillus periandrae]|uniref:RadC family protein n=1 Tax=Paenibacillus periandrae TaxID=1761741 RepID=UPI001F09357B|nr:DNA repair protein RadC [Paenibacillus periandrae]